MPHSQPHYDVVALGNAIVDVIVSADEATLADEGMAKGGMMLIDEARAAELYARIGAGREVSGGSAANTLAGMAALGRSCAFVGQVADDPLGSVFAGDIRAAGVDFAVAARPGPPATARCIILVTPDGQRTMSTFLGAAQHLAPTLVDPHRIGDAAIVYLEGYLWDPAEPRAAMRLAIDAARRAGRKVAFTLSDAFVVERHRKDICALIAAGDIDILFANAVEIVALAGDTDDDFDAAVARFARAVPLLVVTRGADGAVAVDPAGEYHQIAAEPVAVVVDTTGAGDLFAAGFLAGLTERRPVAACLRMGAIAAAEIISHYGARPEADLRALVTAALER